MSRTVGGALVWFSVIHFFLVEELVRRTWTVPYSWQTNYVSDLGATTCGPYFDREICSPGHAWMNLSFGLVGIAIILGAMLLAPTARDLFGRPLLPLYVVGGVGAVLVGLFPLDTIRPMHALSAGLLFASTNLAHVLLGWRLFRRHHRRYGVGLALVGVAGLLGTAFLAEGSTLGVGVGFVQRLAVYGSVLGVVASALVLLSRRRVSGARGERAAHPA